VHLERIDEQPGAGRLGRHVEHDERSRDYAVELEELAPAAAVEWKRWSPILDQGQLGSCTGNAMAGWLGCEPHVASAVEAARYTEHIAVQLYESATKLDAFPGVYPPDDTGSTGNAVAKAARSLGYITRYSWAFSVSGLLHALRYAPVIVGAPWYEGFDQPDAAGMVQPTGQIRGGHEFLIRGYKPGATLNEGVLLADNSWSTAWGDNGSFRFSVATWRKLRAERADVTVPKL